MNEKIRSLPPHLEFGWGRTPIPEQLADSGIDREALEHFDKDADAISRLRIRGIINSPERDKAVKRLTKAIETAFRAALSGGNP